MPDPLLIVNASAIQSRSFGDYRYRVEQPSVAMGGEPGITVVNIATTSPFFERTCLQADVLIVHLLTGQDLLPILEERKRKNNCTIFEIPDNFMDFHRSVGVHALFSDPVNTASAFQYIRMADAVQTTGTRLQMRYSFVNNNIRVFENHLMQPGTKREQNPDKTIIGWAGSLGHIDDLKFIMPAVSDLCHRFENVRFHFMGNRDHFNTLSAPIPEAQKQYTPTGTLGDYLHFLENLDIGIAPLTETEYNHCRSDIKFVEYASRGVVPVLSSLTPYQLHAVHGRNAFLFKNGEEFLSSMAMLINDRDLRARIGGNAYNYACTERMERQHAPDRVEFYRSMCRERPAKSMENLPLSRISPDAEAFMVEKTPAEAMLLCGINAEIAGDVTTARTQYENAHVLDPGFYLPKFRLGYCALRNKMPDAAVYLEHASAINPRALRALTSLGDLYADRDEQKALHFYNKALAISAAFTPAIEGIASIFERNKNFAKADELYNSALLINPFSSNALLGLGRVYEAVKKKENALRAYETAADLAPGSAEAQLCLAEFYFKTGRYYDASKYGIKAMELDPKREATRRLLNTLSALDANKILGT